MSDRTPPSQATTLRCHPVRVLSFGYLHTTTAPQADLTFDVRRYLRDPAAIQGANLLDSNGHDPAVKQVVLATPGAITTLAVATMFAARFPTDRPCTVAFGCAGGRHRSAALAELLAARLTEMGVPVTVRHLHIALPRVLRTTDDTSAVDGGDR